LTTILQLIQSTDPEAARWWDREDYQIHSPVSLDDLARVEVILINRDGNTRKIELGLFRNGGGGNGGTTVGGRKGRSKT